MTPLRLLKLFFDDVLVDMIVGYTKFYSHRERADISFENTNEKIEQQVCSTKIVSAIELSLGITAAKKKERGHFEQRTSSKKVV